MEDLQQLMDILSHACKGFALTISIMKSKVMGQGIVSPPSINIDSVTLDAVDIFTYSLSRLNNRQSYITIGHEPGVDRYHMSGITAIMIFGKVYHHRVRKYVIALHRLQLFVCYQHVYELTLNQLV